MIDAGVGTYTRQTFSDERYSIWTMQGNYHNVPMVNGVPQAFGAKYKARQTKADERSKAFSLDIAGAYPEEAAVKSWTRTYKLGKDKLSVTDTYQLTETKAPNQLNFLTWGQVEASRPGTVDIDINGVKAQLRYDAGAFSLKLELIQLTDKRLSNVWGPQIYRIAFTAQKKSLAGTYKFEIIKK